MGKKRECRERQGRKIRVKEGRMKRIKKSPNLHFWLCQWCSLL